MRRLHELPGLLAALALALVAQPVASALGSLLLSSQGLDPAGRASPVSAIPVAVILGLVVANAVGVPDRLASGLERARGTLLRLGIVLVGLKLSVLDVLEVGLLGVPVVVALVVFASAVALRLGRRLGVGPRLASLAAASTAICGITATLAIAPSIDADDREVAYTVANVTLFGLVAMLTYPYLAHLLFADAPAAAGLFLGTAIHDTSQVMGAAMAYQELFDAPRALQVATVAKLTRNALLVAVVPVLGWLHASDRPAGGPGGLARLFPTFVLGFLALSAVRTAGDVALGDAAAWQRAVDLLGGEASSLALATALAAVGLQTRLSVLRGLGPRPFVVGLGAALAVGGASLALATLAGPLL